jgi:hypothetical protein
MVHSAMLRLCKCVVLVCKHGTCRLVGVCPCVFLGVSDVILILQWQARCLRTVLAVGLSWGVIWSV